jgi:hypothetical protein
MRKMVGGDIDRERPTTHITRTSTSLARATPTQNELHERRHQNLDFDARDSEEEFRQRI